MNSFSMRLLAGIYLAFTGLTAIAADDWVEESNANTLQVMEAQARMSPESFSSLGIESVDAEVMDLGPEIYERSQAAWKDLVAVLEERKKTTENPRVLQDLDILIKSLHDQIRTDELEHKYMLPYYKPGRRLSSADRPGSGQKLRALFGARAAGALPRRAGKTPG